ncbi:MAG: SIMPL domain-containing protein [Hyphomicrobiaceae bacterium]
MSLHISPIDPASRCRGRVLSAMVLAMSCVVGWGTAALAEEKQMQRTVTVSAEGSVAARPDIARLSGGVVTEAETARAALSDNSTIMTAHIDHLKKAGIASADLQTSSFNVSPRYTNRRDGQAQRIDGYRVSNEVHVVVRDLKRVGDVLDMLVSQGANQIGALSFDIAEPDAIKDKARKQAFENARRRAALYAEAGGAALGEVLTISEEAAHGVPRGPMLARAAMAESVPVEAGSQQVDVRVTVTWALK